MGRADEMAVPGRLAGLASTELDWLPGVRVYVAAAPWSRLLGLAWLSDLPADCALLIPRCRSVHTFGMRFALEVAFLDEGWQPIGPARAGRPRRILTDRRAAAVLERRAR